MLPEILDKFNALFGNHVVFSVGILLFIGYFAGQLAEKINLPSITGFIITGLFMGEGVLGIVSHDMAHSLTSVTEIALGIIALTIGGEFSLTKIKKFGPIVFILTLIQAFLTFILVTFAMMVVGIAFHYSVILGVVATATAPAATVVVIRQLRARGEFVDYLYGIVAFDDAVCVVLFSIVFALVSPTIAEIAAHAEHSGVFAGILHASREIGFSLILGTISGFVLNFLVRKKYKLNEILIISLGILFLNISISLVLKLSLLIANMVMGAVLINLSPKNHKIFRVIEPLTPPLFALFFVIAGTELDISVFTRGIVIFYGLVFSLSRFAGKYSGIYFGSMLTGTSKKIQKYLGFCLIPQAGVAIGLVLLVQASPILQSAPPAVQEKLVMMVNIILFSVFINELIGPAVSKFGIVRGADL
jgi:Kef-type K+ transport system membrane component KefB